MLKKKYIRGPLKVLSFAVCFAAIFLLLQPFFVPKFQRDSTSIVNGFYKLEEDSLDVLFLGASQMFCGVNAQKLTEEYGISSYDFGASAQSLNITDYYLREALKTQKPKLVMVEVCAAFYTGKVTSGGGTQPDQQTLAWSYSPVKPSMEKYKSLYAYFDGDAWEAAKYAFLPLLPYHTWWSSVWIDGVKSSFGRGADFLEERGFLRHDRATSYPIAYIGDEEGEEKTIPPENDEALSAIAATCEENGIALVFFKAPVAKWTRAESKVVKAYMAEHGYTYLELNDHLDEIGIAPETDFYNELHLNTSGANKTTDFLANYLKERF